MNFSTHVYFFVATACRCPPPFPVRSPSRQPRTLPLKSIAWSADSYQLATLDAGHVLRLWWMRPEPGQPEYDERSSRDKPLVPELAASIGPFMMSLSGKAPLTDALEEVTRPQAPDAATGGAPHPADSSSGASGGGSGSADVCGARTLAFHPRITVTGTQPSVMLPQVTGDVLCITTAHGE